MASSKCLRELPASQAAGPIFPPPFVPRINPARLLLSQRPATISAAALSWRPRVLRMLRSVVDMGQVLFGTDYPYLRRDLAVECRHEVNASLELDSDESRAVLADTALNSFPRLAGGRA